MAGRNTMKPPPVAVTPLIWAWAPCPAGFGGPGGMARVQVVPPLPLSQAALVLVRWPGRATSPAIRIWFP